MRIAILGYGTIGQGVSDVIYNNRSRIESVIEEPIEIAHIFDRHEHEEDPLSDKITQSIEDILSDDEIDICIEALGGLHPAFEYVSSLLQNGISVATSNKALVAEYGPKLFQMADSSGAIFRFEGAVGGGIPILHTLNNSLVFEEVEEIYGILNGTTNFILSKMLDLDMSYEEVLREAQEMGYAEKDPTDDVEGYDAARKIAILLSMATGKKCDYQSIETEGISGISESDMDYARRNGLKLRLLAQAKRDGEAFKCKVSPVYISDESPLYSVNDSFNAILVKTNSLGESMYYARGAGASPTASAVVSDLIEIAKSFNLDEVNDLSRRWTEEELEIGKFDEEVSWIKPLLR